jgi:hypothetical protein
MRMLTCDSVGVGVVSDQVKEPFSIVTAGMDGWMDVTHVT